MPFKVRVPATSANLGPGFDTLGLALSFHDDLIVRPSKTNVSQVRIEGVGAGEVDTDERNLVLRSVQHVFTRCERTMPPIEIDAHNQIPHGRGMGSSAAAIVAGVMIAAQLLRQSSDPIRLSDANLLAFATELEGHPDNVAPALMGGLTIAWMAENDEPRVKALSVHRGVYPLVLVPDVTMSTKLARTLQPNNVPHEDAVFNLSRSALLVAALTQSPELLFESTEDRLHQNYRGEAMPATRDLIAQLRSAGHAAVVSGAGPSILVLCADPADRKQAAHLAATLSTEWTPLFLTVDIKGATVETIPAQ